MDITVVIKLYLQALENGSYDDIVSLFAEDGMVISPLYGTVKAFDFYRDLFKDTAKSKITLLDIFTSKSSEYVGAAHFRYEWTLKNGDIVSFECVDIFEFSEDGKIKKLKIIYDTYETRRIFEKIKE
jgi:ketosteroid isomerase-like protein